MYAVVAGDTEVAILSDILGTQEDMHGVVRLNDARLWLEVSNLRERSVCVEVEFVEPGAGYNVRKSSAAMEKRSGHPIVASECHGPLFSLLRKGPSYRGALERLFANLPVAEDGYSDVRFEEEMEYSVALFGVAVGHRCAKVSGFPFHYIVRPVQ